MLDLAQVFKDVQKLRLQNIFYPYFILLDEIVGLKKVAYLQFKANV